MGDKQKGLPPGISLFLLFPHFPSLFSSSLFLSFTTGAGVSSQLVFQTQSVHKGKERDFIDLHLNDNEITTPTVL